MYYKNTQTNNINEMEKLKGVQLHRYIYDERTIIFVIPYK